MKITELGKWLEPKINRLVERDRRRQSEEFEHLLAPDLTGQIFLRCKEEAEKIKARLDSLSEEISRAEAKIKEARAAVWAASTPVMKPVRRRGDIFGGFEIVREVDPLQRIRGPLAIKAQKEQLEPALKRQAWLLLEKQRLENDLRHLKKIALLASEGSPAIINFLSARWSSILQVGHGIKLPPMAKLLDGAGYELPPQALDHFGEPDLPAGRPPRD
jgi:hypothetical protein